MAGPAKKLTWRLLLVVVSVSFGGWFTYGFTAVATNAPQRIMRNWIRSVQCVRYGGQFNHTNSNTSDSLFMWCHPVPDHLDNVVPNPTLDTIWAVQSCIPALGALLSIWLVSALLHRFGSKGTLLVNNLSGIIGTILIGLCVIGSSFEMLIIGRFVIGLNIGINVAVIPLYIAELSPANLRGALGTIPGAFLVFGMLFVNVLGLPQLLGTPTKWPGIFWVYLIPGVVLYAVLPFCPESPQHLFIVKGHRQKAKEALQWLRGTEDVEEELKVIQAFKDKEKSKVLTVIELLKDPFLRKVLAVCVCAILAPSVSGIGGFLNYSTAIFISAGLGTLDSLYGSLGLMAIQIFALFAAIISTDRLGRRPLLLISCAGIVVSNIGMLLFMSLGQEACGPCQWVSLVCALIFVFFVNLGTRSVPWLLASEMFTQSTRGAAMIVVSAFSWGSYLVVVFVFPLLKGVIGQWIFAVIAGLMLLICIYIYFRLIETKGKTFEEIQDLLRQKFVRSNNTVQNNPASDYTIVSVVKDQDSVCFQPTVRRRSMFIEA